MTRSRIAIAAATALAVVGGSVVAGVLPTGAATTETADRMERRVVATTLAPPPIVPINGNCESWRPLLEKYGIPYNEAKPRMIRESQCSNAYWYNPPTRDWSFGPLQVNRYPPGGSMDRWWNSGGYTVDVMRTPEGAVAAAAVLYHHVCGWSSWTPPYTCNERFPATPIPAWGETA